MKTRQIIGGIVLTIGLFLAVCTKDGSNYELILRGTGLALTAIGAAIGDFFEKEAKQ